MYGKVTAICAALVAVAALMIAPSAVTAAATLQDTSGGVTTKLEPGVKFTGYSLGTYVVKGAGLTMECNENIITGSVHKNDGTEFQLTVEDAWFQSNLNASGTKCKSNLGEIMITIPKLTNGTLATSHWCIRNAPNTDNFELWGNNCTTEVGTGEFTTILDTPAGECKYKRTTAIKGTFTTETNGKHEAALFTMSNDAGLEGIKFTRHEGAFICPVETLFSGLKFQLFTDPGTSGTYVEPAKAPNPVFIKNEA